MRQEKVDSMVEYLKDEFQDCEVTYAYDFDHISYVFKVVERDTIYIIKIRRSVLDDISDIDGILKRWEVSDFMRNNIGKHILVTTRGLEVL